MTQVLGLTGHDTECLLFDQSEISTIHNFLFPMHMNVLLNMLAIIENMLNILHCILLIMLSRNGFFFES